MQEKMSEGHIKYWHVLTIGWIIFITTIAVALFLNNTLDSSVSKEIDYVQKIHDVDTRGVKYELEIIRDNI